MGRTYANISEVREFGGERTCITHLLADISGGVTLDLNGYRDDVVKEGQVIVYNPTSGVFKPLGLEGGQYKALEGGFTPVGVAIATTPKEEPLVGVMTMGQVVKARLPYEMSDGLAKALPLIKLI